MQSVRKKLLKKPCFQLVVKGVFRQGRCYIFRQGIPGLWACNRESTTTDGWSLSWWHQKAIGACSMKWLLERLRTGTSGPMYGGALLWRTLNVSRAILCLIRSKMRNQSRVAHTSVIAGERLLIRHTAHYCVNLRPLGRFAQKFQSVQEFTFCKGRIFAFSVGMRHHR